ncbi:helix-turn-helix domain-containing protein [Sodaliphilus sp.]|uniref:helix-turn-helix domain-containing protein n=1 Tax=Sodaliphilus sp. TaxID=2815818 RepID=UPI00388EE2F7
MRKKTLEFLEAHQSDEPSTFVEDARWRAENAIWLRWSQSVAMSIVDYMQENGLSRSDVAQRLGCTPQYVSRILSGKTNFSFKSIAEIETKLGISCMAATMA